MSLLDSTNESVWVYPEEVTVDADGNKKVKPSADGLLVAARIWPLSSTEKAEDDGVHTSTRFGLRFPRSFPHVLGAGSQVEWNGKRYSVIGDPISFNGSARTRRLQYILERS